MPHIDITMYPGRSEELKAELAKNVRDCAAETLKMDKKYFSVSIEEVDKDKWEEHNLILPTGKSYQYCRRTGA